MISFPTFYHICKGCTIRRDRFYTYMDELYLPIEYGYNKAFDGMLIPAEYIPIISEKTTAEFLEAYSSDFVSPDLAQELTPTSKRLGDYLDDIRKVMPQWQIETKDAYIDLSTRKQLRSNSRNSTFVGYSVYCKGESQHTDHYIAEHCFTEGTPRSVGDSVACAKRAFNALSKATDNQTTVTFNDGIRKGKHTYVGVVDCPEEVEHRYPIMVEFVEKWKDVLYPEVSAEESTCEAESTEDNGKPERHFFIETVNKIYTGKGIAILKDTIYADPKSDKLYYMLICRGRLETDVEYIDVELANSDQAEELVAISVIRTKFGKYLYKGSYGLKQLEPDDPEISKYYRALSTISMTGDIHFTNCYVQTTSSISMSLTSASSNHKTVLVFPVRSYDHKLLGYVSSRICESAVSRFAGYAEECVALSKLRRAVYKVFPESEDCMVVLPSGARPLAQFTIGTTGTVPAYVYSGSSMPWVEKWTDTILEAFVSADAEEGIKEAEAAELEELAVVSEIPASYDDISVADSQIEKLYERLVPRLDSIGYTQDEIKAAVKWNNGWLDDMDKKLEELAKDQREIHTYVIDTNNEVTKYLSKIQDRTKLTVDAVTQLYREMDGVRGSIRELVLKQDEDNDKIVDHIANTKCLVEAVRIAIHSIIDVFQKTLNALDKEFAESKVNQLRIESGVNTLVGAAHDIVEYQERILQNQERKGFWNWLKSLFKK